jgi:hypothetical protein
MAYYKGRNSAKKEYLNSGKGVFLPSGEENGESLGAKWKMRI